MGKIVAIIPAKGESTRIHRKNLVDLGGYPLVAWTIWDAVNTDCIDTVYVSTDDSDISRIGIEYGAIPLGRMPDLCQSDTPTEAVIEDVLKQIPEPEIIVLMQCTSPFREKGVIDKAVEKLKEEKADSLFFGYPLGRWIWSRDCKSLNYDYKKRIMTQDKKWELVESGDYIFKTELFKKEKNRLGGKIICFEINELGGIDIDNEFSLAVARGLQMELMLYAKD